jgi:TPP-dependent pyruvate/acetoin dehydrogenase alpha subunit
MMTKKGKTPKLISLTREEQLEMLRKIYAIRFFEDVAGGLYKKGLTKGSIHTSIGQEAVVVGVSAHLKDKDYIISTHRGHGHHIAKGADLKRLMAEILGKETGYCAGRGGSMHVAAFNVGSLGAFPIVAAGWGSARPAPGSLPRKVLESWLLMSTRRMVAESSR